MALLVLFLALVVEHGLAQSVPGQAGNTSDASAAPPAQQGNAAELATREETTFKVNVNLVNVRVVVRDAQGRTIGTLTKDDFQLFDNGKPQAIARFAAEHNAPAVRPTAGPEQPVQAPQQYLAYLFDDVHIQSNDLTRLQQAAVQHLDTLSPTDRAAILTTSGRNTLDFTDDKSALKHAVLALALQPVTGSGQSLCPHMPYYLADQIENKHDPRALQVATIDALQCAFNSDQNHYQQAQQLATTSARLELALGQHQTQLALNTLADAINRIGHKPGQRTIILASPGFLNPNDQQEQNHVIDRALQSNVIISTLDARGLYTDVPGGDSSESRHMDATIVAETALYASQSASTESMVLGEFADATGGTYFKNSNDLEEGFRRAATAPEYYYMLAFTPQSLKLNGAYHTIKVTLKDKQPYSLQARKGYYAPNRMEDPREQARQDINEAVFSQEERHDLPIQVHTKFFKLNDEAAKLAILAHVDVRQLRFHTVDGRHRNDLTVVSALFDRNGNFIQGDQKTLEMRLTDQTLQNKLQSGVTLRANFDVKSGSYIVRLVVRDDEGQISAVNDTVEIP